MGTGFCRASYHKVCSKLVNDCLHRMKASKKVLRGGNEEQTVVHLFRLESNDSYHKREITLPEPSPAPDVNTLWLILNRPEVCDKVCFALERLLNKILPSK